MTKITMTVEEAYDAVVAALSSNEFQLIAIGGNLSAGKTHFTRSIGLALNLRSLHLDKFLNSIPGAYLQSVGQEIKLAKARALPFLVEGIGVLKTLDALGLKHDVLLHIEGAPRPSTMVTDAFYAEHTTMEPIGNIIEHYDNQALSRELADILVVRND